jgi:hypothetical protein
MLQRWVEHTENWKDQGAGIHYITYEDLHTQFAVTLGHISDILGQPASIDKPPALDAPSSFPWRGSTGSWKDYFTTADEHYFNLHARPQSDKCK